MAWFEGKGSNIHILPASSNGELEDGEEPPKMKIRFRAMVAECDILGAGTDPFSPMAVMVLWVVVMLSWSSIDILSSWVSFVLFPSFSAFSDELERPPKI